MKLALISTAAALMTCASLAAQTPARGSSAPGSSQSPTYPAPSSAARTTTGTDAITVTGCVESSGGAFKLTKVADASTASASGSQATRAESAAAKDPEALLDEYALTADPSINLSQHVNHKVTVTGAVSKTAATSVAPSASPSMSSPSGSTASARPSGGMAGASSALDAGTLKVTSLRMVSSSCQ